jgi:hypothetical protein
MAEYIRLRVRPQPGHTTGRPETDWAPRPVAFLISFAAHTALVAIFHFPPGILGQPPAPGSRYTHEIVMLPSHREVLWLPAQTALPDISPAKHFGEAPQPRARELSRAGSMIVQPPHAPSGRQLIWRPERPSPLETEIPAPNMIAVEGTAAKARPKPFVAPAPGPPSARPVPQRELLEAPDLKIVGSRLPLSTPPVSLSVSKPKLRAFVPPKERRPRLPVPGRVLTEAPPEVALSSDSLEGVRTARAILGRIKTDRPVRPQPKGFVPTARAGRPNGAGEGAILEAPPQVATSNVGSGAVTAAVIGLDPLANTPSALPDGSRLASFSRAPGTGEPSSGEPHSGLTIEIPVVATRGSKGSLAPSPPLGPAAPSGGAVIEIRVPVPALTMSAPLWPSSRMIPQAIEAKFRDRVVYTLVIPKPNLSQYTDDWTIWFSGKDIQTRDASLMQAPVPIRKMMSSEAAEFEGVESWVQIEAVINRNGKPESVTPLPGRSPEIAAQAARDVAEWEFRPAARNGQPVDAEVIIVLPFRVPSRLAKQQ